MECDNAEGMCDGGYSVCLDNKKSRREHMYAVVIKRFVCSVKNMWIMYWMESLVG